MLLAGAAIFRLRESLRLPLAQDRNVTGRASFDRLEVPQPAPGAFLFRWRRAWLRSDRSSAGGGGAPVRNRWPHRDHSSRLANLVLSWAGPATVLLAGTLAQAGTADLNVMTFNIKEDDATNQLSPNSWVTDKSVIFTGDRRDKAIDKITSYAPDILGEQEGLPNQVNDLKAALPGYTYYGQGRGGNGSNSGETNGIFYLTSRFTDLGHGDFWLSDTPTVPGTTFYGTGTDTSNPRMVSWIKLNDNQSHQTYFTVDTHWSLDSLARDESATLMRDQISQLAGGLPVLVIGDFNAELESSSLQTLDGSIASGFKLTDAYRNVYPTIGVDESTSHHFTGDQYGASIDHIFYDASTFTATAAQIVHTSYNGLYPSDHFPVTATLQVTVVPEPASIVLGLSALLLITLRRPHSPWSLLGRLKTSMRCRNATFGGRQLVSGRRVMMTATSRLRRALSFGPLLPCRSVTAIRASLVNGKVLLLVALFGVALNAPSATAGMVSWNVDSSASYIQVTTTFPNDIVTLVPQGPGADQTNYQGTISGDLSGGSISLTSAALNALVNGTWQPIVGGRDGSADADYGFTLGGLASGTAAFRNILFDVSGGPSTIGGTGDFDATGYVLGITAGDLDYNAVVLGASLMGTTPLAGQSAPDASAIGNLSVSGITETLTLPINAAFPLDVNGLVGTVSLSGTIVGVRTVPEPATFVLLGLAATVVAPVAVRRFRKRIGRSAQICCHSQFASSRA